jgi:hypothetical protein
MSKLTKTEQHLIKLAAQRGGRYGVDTAWGKGRGGGRFSCGGRDLSALRKLVDRGFAEIIKQDSWSECVGNGYWQHGTVFSFRLTERAAEVSHV